MSSSRQTFMLQWGRVLTNAETGLWFPEGHLPRVDLASMGPRSHERGNAQPHTGIAAAIDELQWGRVLTNAETHVAEEFVDPGNYASMGPRSHERGNTFTGLTPGDGPEVIEQLQWGRVLTNAETACRCLWHDCGPARPCFNGAAFSRTRKRDDKRPCFYWMAEVDVLQWGRVLTNAETSISSSSPDAPLQWGRVLKERKQHCACHWRMLQWGRVLTNAETSLGGSYRGLLNRQEALQWGRVLTNAETPEWRRGVGRPESVAASMGPRSHERGNNESRALVRQSVPDHLLQWGRVLTNAETNPKQLSAARALIEPETPFFVRRRPFLASMGPRSHERGNRVGKPGACTTPWRRFNGAAFSRTRKPDRRSSRPPELSAR